MSWGISLDEVWGIGLASVRVLALLFVAPVFSHLAVPVRIRVSLAILFVVSTAPLLASTAMPIDPSPVTLAASLAQEVMIGAVLGFAIKLVFSAFALLGEFVSVQGGLGAATVLDPSSGTNSVVMTSLLQFFALALFLAIDGHHSVLRAMALSFEELPVGAAMLDPARLVEVTAMGSIIYAIAVKLAAPVTAVMLVSNVAVGMLGRAIPQLNLMALQLPVHVGITLLILGLSAGPLTDAAAQALNGATELAISTVLGGG